MDRGATEVVHPAITVAQQNTCCGPEEQRGRPQPGAGWALPPTRRSLGPRVSTCGRGRRQSSKANESLWSPPSISLLLHTPCLLCSVSVPSRGRSHLVPRESSSCAIERPSVWLPRNRVCLGWCGSFLRIKFKVP